MKMMRQILCVSLLVVLAACGGGKKVGGNYSQSRLLSTQVEYNPLVESFTSGMIGRKSSVEITFAEPVAENADLSSLIRMSPKVKGEWTATEGDRRNVIFRPQDEFQRGQVYEVEVSINKLFPTHPNVKDFSFVFGIVSTAASAKMTTFSVDDDGTYSVQGVLSTSDFEDSTRVRQMVQWSETGKGVHWTHAADGRTHKFIVSGLPSAKDRSLVLSVKDKASGYQEKSLLEVPLPSSKEFKLHSVEYVDGQEKYIEIRFNRQLSTSQPFEGMVWLEDINSVGRWDGNKVLLYPASGNDSKSATLFIDAALQSTDGQKFGEDKALNVEFGGSKPAVRFLGTGTVLPPSSVTAEAGGRGIPFQAIHLRAVEVNVFRISEGNIGQFLQENRINETDGNLTRVARPVTTKTIFLDQNGTQGLDTWKTYSLDLDELMETEPGAIYRVTLSFDRSMAALDCIPPEERISPRVAQENDRLRQESRQKQFDRGGYYYGRDYGYYSWREREDPCTQSYYYNTTVQRNLLVTDLGVIAKASDLSEMLFLVNSISTTDPVADAKIQLFNYQNQPVGSGTTDASGQAMVKFEKGRPFYAVVSKGDERTYLRVNSGSELSTSNFDVSGEQLQEGMRGFIWTERGVWRPGDTIYLNFVTANQHLPQGHPVTIDFTSPMGQLYQRKVATEHVGGIYTFVLHTEDDSPTGIWSATVRVGGASFYHRIRVETIKPNRLKIDLKFPKEFIQRGQSLNAQLHGEWLTGAKAGNLKYTIETQFRPLYSSFPKFPDYVFRNNFKRSEYGYGSNITGTTDADGNATIKAVVAGGEKADGMLSATITTRLFEPSGDASVDMVSMRYSPFDHYVGIKTPEVERGRQLDTDKSYEYQIATVDPEGNPSGGRNVDVEVYKVDWYWWWSSSRSDLANYISYRSIEPYKTVSLRTDATGKTKFDMKVGKYEWGTYYISATDTESKHQAGTAVYIDWPYYYGRRGDQESGAAMRLNVSLDKEEYHPGQKATVTFPAMKGSRALISIENGSQVLKVIPVDCKEGNSSHKIDITPDMRPNVYVNVTLLQPFGSVENDLPVRLYGIVPLKVTSAESKLEPVIEAPDEVLPETEVTITVKEKKGREMAYSLVMVDEGLLDLTRFKTPDPWGNFNAKIAHGISTWDIYNYVLGAYGGKIEQMFAIGGDDELDDSGRPNANRFPPVVKYLGTFELAKGKTGVHKVTLPPYMGRVKIMAVAVSQTADQGNGAWGSAEKSVFVRSPLMVLASGPRAVAPKDEIIIPATVVATEDGIGNVTVKIEHTASYELVGPATQQVTMNGKEEKVVYFRLKVKDAAKGNSQITITATGGGKTSRSAMNIPVRNLTLPVTEGFSYTVEAGKTWKGKMVLKGVEGTRSGMLEVSSIEPMNTAQRMFFLNNYPYGCIEQITSGGFPYLYLPELTELSENELANVQSKVRHVLNRYKGYATPDGSMGYWTGSTSPSQWGSVYALHFMTVAGNKGYDLPVGVYDRLKAAVQSSAVRWNSQQYPHYNLIQAYQLYVLALAGEPETGAMNRLRQSEKMSTDTRRLLASAYALTGRTDVGKTLLPAADTLPSQEEYWMTYGSSTRSVAMELLTYTLLEMGPEAARVARPLSKAMASNEWMSTQTTAWSMMAMGEWITRTGAGGGLDFEWQAAGEKGTVDGKGSGTVWTRSWDNPTQEEVSVKNNTNGLLYIRTVGSWTSLGDNTPKASSGLEVNVRYLNDNGQEIDATQLERGVDFTAEVSVRNTGRDEVRDLMLSQPVASGWEILPSNRNANYPRGVTYRDIRDDRIDFYIPRLPGGSRMTTRVRLNATFGGTYILPSVHCEAMYDAKISGNTASGYTHINN